MGVQRPLHRQTMSVNNLPTYAQNQANQPQDTIPKPQIALEHTLSTQRPSVNLGGYNDYIFSGTAAEGALNPNAINGGTNSFSPQPPRMKSLQNNEEIHYQPPKSARKSKRYLPPKGVAQDEALRFYGSEPDSFSRDDDDKPQQTTSNQYKTNPQNQSINKYIKTQEDNLRRSGRLKRRPAQYVNMTPSKHDYQESIEKFYGTHNPDALSGEKQGRVVKKNPNLEAKYYNEKIQSLPVRTRIPMATAILSKP